ncbi:MAG TPA: branched-chain amino acid ABC transporter substrate-binding protein [Syntrophales bacterium]|nr:branched-chain amino acid ABC transporter substrate-binding protein [Syntrophales bacterium]
MKKILFFLLAFCFLASMAHAQETIKIGLMAPLTGSFASEGAEMKQVLELLAADLNAKGGLLGKKVELIVDDDGSDARTAALAAQRLTTKGVVAVIGTYGSSVTEASQNIFNEAKIIQVANGSTAIRLSEKNLKYFFRTCPRDDEQGKVAVDAIVKTKAKKVAILHDNSTYAKGLADEVKAPLEKKGIKIVFFDALTPKQSDYTAVLTKMKGAGPDLVFFTGYYSEAGLLLKQAKQMSWKVPFMGGDATYNTDLVKLAGKEAVTGFSFVMPPLPKYLPSKQAKAFLASFKKKYGSEPTSPYSVLAGDGFRVVTAAIAQTKTTDADKLAGYLKTQFKDKDALTGTISFNAKGDRVGDVYRYFKFDNKGNIALQK